VPPIPAPPCAPFSDDGDVAADERLRSDPDFFPDVLPSGSSGSDRAPWWFGAPVLIKICGVARPEDAAMAVEAGADLVGFVLVPGTSRAVDPDRAGWIRALGGAGRVGVFRDAPLDEIRRVRDRLRLDRVQLHGDEPDEWLELLAPGVIRRVPVPGSVDWERVRALAGAGVLPLLDPGAGDGRAFDRRLLEEGPGDLRYGLAGGLTPGSVGAAVRAGRPALVDVSSGVESAPGVKDPAKVRAFVAAARNAAAQGGGCPPGRDDVDPA